MRPNLERVLYQFGLVYGLLCTGSSGGQHNARFNQLSPAGFSNSQLHSQRISLINLLEKTASFMLNDGIADNKENEEE
jgi:hypothetical protein